MGLCCICGFQGGFCRFRGIASCAGIVERSELVPGAAVVPSAHLFPAFLHTIVDPRKDHVPGKRVPKTVAPTAPLAVFMTAAGVVVRQRHGFKDQKAAHKAHAGKQLFPEVHSLHLVRLQRPHPFHQPIDPTQVVFFPAAGAHHLKAAFFRRKRTLHPDPQI